MPVGEKRLKRRPRAAGGAALYHARVGKVNGHSGDVQDKCLCSVVNRLRAGFDERGG